MKKVNFSNITLEEFLKDYWQQKPILLKKGFENFKDIITADELAGLASCDFIESRLISIQREENKKISYQAELGPFDNYDKFGEKDWTLVVQATNHWIRDLDIFANRFSFIPKWCFDDVMVSFASAGGGVGPHIDLYDVFICQGSGKRHWKVGQKGNYKEIIAHEKLLHIEEFQPIIDEVVEAGDILYIPPGFPHEGVSLNSSMSFSVGYKSTNENELVSGFADFMLDNNIKPKLLKNLRNQPSENLGEIENIDKSKVTDFLRKTLESDDLLDDFIGRFYSQQSHELDINEVEYLTDEWLDLFKSKPLYKLHGLKVFYTENSIKNNSFFINGDVLKNCPPNDIKIICNSSVLNFNNISENSHKLMKSLTNQGFWFFSED